MTRAEQDEWVLVLETAVPQASLCLAKGEEIVARETFESERSQEVDLFEPLQRILGQIPAGVALSELVVGTGPGSYNGARVGIAVAQAVGQAQGCGGGSAGRMPTARGARVTGLCSFEGVAELAGGGWAVGDARRGSFFRLRVDERGRVAGEAELLEAEEFERFVEACAGENLVTFESPERLPGKAGASVLEGTSTAEGLWRSWRGRTEGERAEAAGRVLEAFYLRPPHITKAKGK
ncbi:MAG: hypothetical protein ACQKBY_11995 [Verrucomicrobiales bacterium]